MLIRTLLLALLPAGILAVAPITARAANGTLTSRAVAFGNYNPLNGAALNRTARILGVTGSGSGGRMTIAQPLNDNPVRLTVYSRTPAQ